MYVTEIWACGAYICSSAKTFEEKYTYVLGVSTVFEEFMPVVCTTWFKNLTESWKTGNIYYIFARPYFQRGQDRADGTLLEL